MDGMHCMAIFPEDVQLPQSQVVLASIHPGIVPPNPIADRVPLPVPRAMAGADANASGLENLDNAIFVFDNEPRNAQIVERMERVLDKGYKVCIWPTNLVDKDINDMILSDTKAVDIQMIIDMNSYSGLEGKLQMSYWRKCL